MTYAKVRSAARTFLRGGAALHAEIAPHLNRKGHAPAKLIAALAEEWCSEYNCEATLTETGWQFKDADGARHGAAQKKWAREVRAYDATPMSNRGGARSKQKDAVSKLLDAYKALSAAEKRRFKASI